MNLLTIGYVYVGGLVVFFLYLIFLMVRTVLPEKKEAHIVAIVASILWGLSIPSSLLMAFLALMGSGGPNTIEWAALMAGGSLFLLLLLSLYSLSNIWQKYLMEDYRSVVRYAAVPFISIILFIISMIPGIIQQTNAGDNRKNSFCAFAMKEDFKCVLKSNGHSCSKTQPGKPDDPRAMTREAVIKYCGQN